MKWTSTRHWLPEEGKQVLVYTDINSYIVSNLYQGNWMIHASPDLIITHWAYIPEVSK